MHILPAILVLCMGSVYAATSPFCIQAITAYVPTLGFSTSELPGHSHFRVSFHGSSQHPFNQKRDLHLGSNSISLSHVCAAGPSTGPTAFDKNMKKVEEMYIVLNAVDEVGIEAVQAFELEARCRVAIKWRRLTSTDIDVLVKSFSAFIYDKHKYLEVLLTKRLGPGIYHKLNELLGDYSISISHVPDEVSTELASNSISTSHVCAAGESIETTVGGENCNIHLKVLDAMYNVLKECSEGRCDAGDNEEMGGSVPNGDIEVLKEKFKSAIDSAESVTPSDFDELLNSFSAVIMPKHSPSHWLQKFMLTNWLDFCPVINAKHLEFLLTKRLGPGIYHKLNELLRDYSISISHKPDEVSTELASNSISMYHVFADGESIERISCYKSLKMIEEMYDVLKAVDNEETASVRSGDLKEKCRIANNSENPTSSNFDEFVNSFSAVINPNTWSSC